MKKTPRWLESLLRATEDDIPPMPYARGERPPIEIRRGGDGKPELKLVKG